LASLLFFCVLLVAGWSAKPEPVLLTGSTMGTNYHVTIVPDTGISVADEVGEGIQLRLDAVNQSMSTYIDNSELSVINSNDSSDWQTVSPMLAEVVTEAIAIGHLTGGALDVSVGPLVNLWGFGPDHHADRVPTDQQITALLAAIGFDKIVLDTNPLRLKRPPGLSIDLSSVAKGYAVDVLDQYLASLGFKHYLVEVGGELITRGHNAKSQAWRIGIEKPSLAHQGVQQAIAMSGKAMATSGDYRNYFEKDGQRFSHIIDPRTGRPITNKLASVSVIAESALRADGLATALTVLGEEAAMALAEQQNIAIYVIISDGDGFKTDYSSAFEEYLLE